MIHRWIMGVEWMTVKYAEYLGGVVQIAQYTNHNQHVQGMSE